MKVMRYDLTWYFLDDDGQVQWGASVFPFFFCGISVTLGTLEVHPFYC